MPDALDIIQTVADELHVGFSTVACLRQDIHQYGPMEAMKRHPTFLGTNPDEVQVRSDVLNAFMYGMIGMIGARLCHNHPDVITPDMFTNLVCSGFGEHDHLFAPSIKESIVNGLNEIHDRPYADPTSN